MYDKNIRIAHWPEDKILLSEIRTQVFINEQNVPETLEWDELDKDCTHLLTYNENGKAIATARMTAHGHIGRMAVLAPYRHSGVGSALLKTLLNIARQNDLKGVFLNAQIQAKGFYEQQGFHQEGKPFDDAGIPHIKMSFYF